MSAPRERARAKEEATFLSNSKEGDGRRRKREKKRGGDEKCEREGLDMVWTEEEVLKAREFLPHTLFSHPRSQRQLFYVSFFKPRFNSCSQSV